MAEINIKDLWDKMETIRTEVLGEVKDLRQHFKTFEAGRVTALEKDVATLKAEKVAIEKRDNGFDKESERRKDWMWGALEKIIFSVIGSILVLAGLILSKVGILNLK